MRKIKIYSEMDLILLIPYKWWHFLYSAILLNDPQGGGILGRNLGLFYFL